jgi:uncharacterized protein
MPTKRRSFTLEGIDEGQRRVHVVASTSEPVKGFDDKGNARLESLRGWKLDRFVANPVILWSHKADEYPIGKGVDINQTADGGLELWIQFPFANERNARAEEVWDLVRTKQVRGISVGFDYGTQSQEGDVAVFTDNELSEVSVVTVPADAGALASQGPTVATEPDPAAQEEARRKKASEAGRALSMHRYGRSDADELVQRFDVMGRAGKVRRTQVGGVRVDARLTRIGVLPYTLADGTVRRELRHPDEVFNSDSLATLQSAPVTDLAHHRSLIGPHNWKEANLGHTENVRSDARYVEGELVINDAATATDVENGKLADISCGYECKLDFTPGVFEGERYDAIQRAIRYNHVAVLPKGRGRAGTDVGVRLDSHDAFCVDNEETIIMKTIRLDGKDFEVGSDAHLAKIEELHKAELARVRSDAADETAKVTKAKDELQANFDAAAKAKKKLEEELEEEKGEKGKARVRARLRLLQRAAKFLTDDEEEEDDKDKDKFDGLSDREVMVKVINADANWKEEKFDGKSDDYVQALFDSVTKNFVRADGIDSVVVAHKKVSRADAGDDDPVSKAEAEMKKNNADQFNKPAFGMTKEQARG